MEDENNKWKCCKQSDFIIAQSTLTTIDIWSVVTYYDLYNNNEDRTIQNFTLDSSLKTKDLNS